MSAMPRKRNFRLQQLPACPAAAGNPVSPMQHDALNCARSPSPFTIRPKGRLLPVGLSASCALGPMAERLRRGRALLSILVQLQVGPPVALPRDLPADIALHRLA